MSDTVTAKGLPTAFKSTGIVSAISITGLIYFNQPNWFLALVVLGFVIGYGVWINSRHHLNTQNDADSIYYLGFGLTIISLAVSSYVHFGSSGDFKLENLKSVFSQFAIGLIATCFGLVGRLIVIAKLDDTKSDETDEIQKRRELVASLGELRLEIVGFADQLKRLNEDLRQQQLELHAETMQKMQQAHQSAMAENSQAIRVAHEQIAIATQNSITQISQMVGTLTQQQLNLHTQSYAGLAELSQKTHAQISALDFVSISKKTNQAVQKLSQSCEDFSTQTAHIQQKMHDSNSHLEQSTAQAAHSLATITDKLDGLTESTQDYNLKIQNSAKILSQTTEQLIDTARKSHQVLTTISQQYDGYEKSHERYLNGCDSILKKAIITSEQLVRSVSEVNGSVSQVESALVTVAKRSTEIAQKFRDSAQATR